MPKCPHLVHHTAVHPLRNDSVKVNSDLGGLPVYCHACCVWLPCYWSLHVGHFRLTSSHWEPISATFRTKGEQPNQKKGIRAKNQEFKNWVFSVKAALITECNRRHTVEKYWWQNGVHLFAIRVWDGCIRYFHQYFSTAFVNQCQPDNGGGTVGDTCDGESLKKIRLSRLQPQKRPSVLCPEPAPHDSWLSFST